MRRTDLRTCFRHFEVVHHHTLASLLVRLDFSTISYAGFDRFMAIACGTTSIRDVIAFPKSGAGTDPLFASPAPLTEGGKPNEDDKLLAAYALRVRKTS